MIIDIILDRKDGAISYDASKHLKAIYDYATDAGMTELATAVDGGTEDDVKAALMCYIATCGYPLELLDYIARVRWTDDAPAGESIADKLAIIRKVATRLRRNIKRETASQSCMIEDLVTLTIWKRLKPSHAARLARKTLNLQKSCFL